jgi:hypothetical protein
VLPSTVLPCAGPAGSFLSFFQVRGAHRSLIRSELVRFAGARPCSRRVLACRLRMRSNSFLFSFLFSYIPSYYKI